MVDFDSKDTIGTPAIDIFRVEVLQAHANVLEAYEDYKKKDMMGQSPTDAVIRARLISWFLIHQPYLKRAKGKEEYTAIYNKVFSKEDIEDEDIREVLLFLNELLDSLQITKLDTRKKFDTTDVELDNKEHNL